jgi:hypothetical protein
VDMSVGSPIANTDANNLPPSNAFDANPATYWSGTTNGVNSNNWIGMEFMTEQTVRCVKLNQPPTQFGSEYVKEVTVEVKLPGEGFWTPVFTAKNLVEGENTFSNDYVATASPTPVVTAPPVVTPTQGPTLAPQQTSAPTAVPTTQPTTVPITPTTPPTTVPITPTQMPSSKKAKKSKGSKSKGSKSSKSPSVSKAPRSKGSKGLRSIKGKGKGKGKGGYNTSIEELPVAGPSASPPEEETDAGRSASPPEDDQDAFTITPTKAPTVPYMVGDTNQPTTTDTAAPPMS